MAVDAFARSAGRLTLQWHAAATTLRLEAFPAWALATLAAELRFDAAAWGWLAAESGAPLPRRLRAVHLHGLGEGAVTLLERSVLRSVTPAGAAFVVRVRVSDEFDTRERRGDATGALPDAMTDADRAAWRELGVGHLVALRCPGAGSAASQLLVLTRRPGNDAFERDAVDVFELLAPHMAQALATCRRLFVDRPSRGAAPAVAVGVALFDRHGALLHGDERVVPMLRREWKDWPGAVLPEPVRVWLSRKPAGSGRFLGGVVSVDVEPAGPHQLLTVRLRHDADVLTARESEVAERYAAGATFREIAELLDLAPATVRAHLRNVFAKLQLRNKAQLAAFLHRG